jgi:TP901 family phage tail tape measure protein
LQSKGKDLTGNEQDGFKSTTGQNSKLVDRYKKVSESYRDCRSEMEYFKENIDECSISEQKLLQLFAQDEALRAALDISTQKYAANGQLAWANLTQKVRQYVDKVYDAASRDIDIKNALDKIREMANSDSEDAYTQYDALKAALANVQRIIDKDGLNDPTWWQRFKRTFGSRARSVFAGFGAGNISKYLQDVYNNVKNIDSAMTQLKIVTGETDERFSQYFKNVASSAKKAGASISSLIESATTFARLGYSLSESETFAELAAAYSNVADTDVSSATTSITTIIKAFGVSADELESVLDRLMYVGQKFPISADELGTGFENAGSALKAAGNDINQSMALLTAANTEIQDISKASTALRTIVARINRSETELEDIGESIEDVPTTAKLQEEMMAYGVSIEDSNGNLRNTYDILTDLSNVWDELNNSQQSAIAELVAGTRQQSIFFGLMNSFDTEAVGVMNSIGEADGELSRATEVYSDSIEGRLKIVSATFEEFSANFLDSDFVKFIVNIVNVAVSGLNIITKGIQKIGGLKTVLLALAATLLVVKGKLIAVNLTAKATAAWTKVTEGITNGIKALTSAIPGAIKAWKDYAAGAISANEAMQASIPVIGLVLAAVSLLITGISIYNNVLDENKEKAREASDSATELSDSIYDLTQKYLSLSKAVSEDKEEKEDLLSTQDELLDNLDLEQWKLDKLVEKYGSYTEAIKAASVEKLKEEERDIRGGLSVAKDELLDESDGLLDKFGEVSGRAAIGESLDKRKDSYAALEALKNEGYIKADSYSVYTDQKTGEKYSNGFSSFLNIKYDTTTLDGIIHAYEDLGKMIDIVGDTSGEDNFVYESLYNEYSGMTDFVNKYKEEVDDLNNNLAQQYTISGLIGQEIPKTQEEFDSYREEVVEAAVASGEFVGTQEDIENAIDSVLRKQSDFSEFYSDAADTITSTVLSLKSVADILDKIQGKYDALVSALNDMEEYGVLTASTFTSIMEDYSDLTDYLTQTENGYILNAEALTQYTSALVASYAAEAESATMTEKNRETAIQNLKNLQTALAMLAVSQSESQSASERRKEELEDEKDALNEQLDAYQELIDLRKELLQQYEDEVSYKKELAEKEKAVSQLQTKLAISQLDTSAAGRAKTRELSEELEEAQSELDDYTLEHAIEVVTNELESQYTEYETYINGEVDNIESLIDSLDNDVGDAAEAISAAAASAAQSITEAIEKLELTSVVNVEGQPLAHGKEKWIESQAFSESSLDYGAKEYKVSHGGNGSSYHTGGIVGEVAKLKSTETFAKLLKGEFVATPQMMHRFMNTTLPEIASSNSSNEFNAPLINIQCENVTQETLPKLESIVKEAVTQIKRQFEGGLGRAGYHKTVKQIT